MPMQRLAVNVSARQFREPDFVAKVQAVIAQTGANPMRLKLELTESLLVDNVEYIIAKMLTLKASGIGYFCLSYLKRLPLCQSLGLGVIAEARSGSDGPFARS